MKAKDRVFWIEENNVYGQARIVEGEIISVNKYFCKINCLPGGKGWWSITKGKNEVYTTKQDAEIEYYSVLINDIKKKVAEQEELIEAYENIKKGLLIEKLAGLPKESR
jgi:hypothetical protein